MNKFANKIIIITGAASGIGFALAQKASLLKMKLVIADIEKEPLQQAFQKLREITQNIIAVCTDIRNIQDLEQLREKTLNTFGIPDVLINSAGVGGPMSMAWQVPLKKIQWVMDVNFYGTVYSIQSFLPAMLEDGQCRHIVNVASMAGFYTAPYLSAYEAAKHALIAWTEALYHDLKTRQSNIQLSVVNPGWVKTNILNDTRNDQHANEFPIDTSLYTEADVKWITAFARAVKKGLVPEQVAEMVFEGIQKNKFYIFTHPEMKSAILNRYQAIMAELHPSKLVF